MAGADEQPLSCLQETAYADDALPGIPPDDGSGVATLGLLLPPFLWQTFKHLGDTMPFMHKKTIHKHGTVAKVAFKVASKKCAVSAGRAP